MLEGLDKINWGKLQGAYGPATEVPLYIRNLTSSDPKVCEDALDKLLWTIFHQTSTYEATSYVVPFFVELLQYDEIQEKKEILGLLSSIAFTNHEAASEGVETYFSLLKSDDSEMRIYSGDILIQFPEKVSEIAPQLRKAFEVEEDTDVKSSFIFFLGLLIAKAKGSLGEFELDYQNLFENLLKSRDTMLKLAASIALAHVVGAKTPVEAVELLIETAANKDAFPHSCWFIIGDAPRALAVLGHSKGIEALSRALLTTTDKRVAQNLMEILLDLAFDGKQGKGYSYGETTANDGVREIIYTAPFTFIKDKTGALKSVPTETKPIIPVEVLTEEQRVALTAVVESNTVWEMRNNLFELYGLPASRAKLRNLVAVRQLSFDW